MKERPILFSGPMVRAILEGRKTQTRRVCKHQHWSYSERHDVNVNGITQKVDRSVSCPYGQPGDRLWVRETWCQVMRDHAHDLLEGWRENRLTVYKTEFHDDWIRYAKEKYGYKWRPSIHMPRLASRITLEIVSVRVERLQDISVEDSIAEGITDFSWKYPPVVFQHLWQSINGPESWDVNPWVWVIEFRRVQP